MKSSTTGASDACAQVLDASAAAACSDRTTRHPYRLAHNSLAPPISAQPVPEAAPSVFADPSRAIGAVAKSWVATPGTTEATEVHFAHNAASNQHSADPVSGSNGSCQQRMSLLHQRLRNAVDGCGTGTGTGTVGSTATPTVSQAGNVEARPAAVEKVQAPGGGLTPGFDYPRYRQSHNKHHGHYIDVRLVPPEEVRAALLADTAAIAPILGDGRARGGPVALLPIPGMRDAAGEQAALGQPAHDGDSAWAPAGRPGRRGMDGPTRTFANDGAMSEGSSESGSGDECMSEEVVSNTIGLCMPQPTMVSGPAGGANGRGKRPKGTGSLAGSGDEGDEGEADSRRPRAGMRAQLLEGLVVMQGDRAMEGEGEGEGSAGNPAGAKPVHRQWQHQANKRVHRGS